MPENCAAIIIAAKHHELIKVKDARGTTNTIGALRCKFQFRTDDWLHSAKTAMFCNGNVVLHPEIIDDAIAVPLDADDECPVPYEVLTDTLPYSIGVWGVTNSGLRVVSNWLVFNAQVGCYTEGNAPEDPEQTIYEEILLIANEAVSAVKDVTQRAESGEFAGKSAYEIAVKNGYTGTETEWLASLVGKDGAAAEKGDDGKSAYDIAVENGYEGTITEWLASLVGAAGSNGKDGEDGYTPVKGIDYFDGVDGKDGYTPVKGVDYVDGISPVIQTIPTADGHQISFTDANGLQTINLMNGKDGEAGTPGEDGFSPILEAEYIFDGTPAHRIFVTDANGKRELCWVHDGADGADGFTPTITSVPYVDENGTRYEVFASTPSGQVEIGEFKSGKDGKDGKDGETPVRGTDYWTEDDKAEIAEEAARLVIDISGKPTEGLEYTISDDGTYYICSGIGTATEKDIVIASEYNGLPVEEIGVSAFEWLNLTSVKLPDTIKIIRANAFKGVYLLKEIAFPSSLTTIESDAFYDCIGFTSLILGENISNVSDLAFNQCTKLKTVVIQANSINLGEYAFNICDLLADIYVPWSEGEVNGAPWGATNATIHYDTKSLEDRVTTLENQVGDINTALEHIIARQATIIGGIS